MDICQFCHCPHFGTLRCSYCHLMWYCPKACQLSDWTCHCHLDRRLCALRDSLLKYNKFSLGNTIYLSNSVGCVWVDGNRYNLTAFRSPTKESNCVICEANVGGDGPLLKNRVSFLYKQNVIDYYRCNKCLAADRLLCQTTLACTTLCRDANRRKVVLLFELALQIDPDVSCLIALLFHSLCTCW